ncbi:tRNA pseudouridine(38-40) synthase TruA [Cyclobacterium plantarum]|uniref:tRNA pseudouridine synthase A n=1 Tax=Cyclobacterium plantarum TaxID=2716263 RepID=A0ABX0H1I5_9BACT|nr:tRNA pseudouridine(38-40) synthase TruA [Cyclobacterium plantarum]NHE55464.1 tRNA pseudouridine(38-40) synthase TruA [Cyclobacterium plantarum]
MKTRPYTYLFRIQYLGLRYHGWQVQKGVKTVQGTLERSIRYVLGHEDFNLLGASRTDSGVSCLEGAFELFLRQALDIQRFLADTNENLPSDIRLLSCQPVSAAFNVIQDVQCKQYGYYFAFGEKPHPFLAGNLAYGGDELDLESMQQAASLFAGKHDFRRFCSQGRNTSDFIREINFAAICPAAAELSFLPAEGAWVFRVRGKGFLMHQVRRMVASLFLLGKDLLSLDELKNALLSEDKSPLSHKAPANGLVLESISFHMEKLNQG